MVTGSGARRIGSHVVDLLAERGYRPVVHAYRSVAEAGERAAALAARGVDALHVAGDVSREEDVRRIFESIGERFGRLDVLVNCAAIWQAKQLEETTAEDVRRHFEVNTLGTFLCAQAAGRMMVPQPEGGAIVNVADWSIARPFLDYVAYFPSKGAIPTLTRALAVELAARNPRIRVNAIMPGAAMMPEEMPEEERRKAIAGTLVKREGSPRDIAAAALFLIESEFITGVCLPVDGGRSIFAEEAGAL